jgi:hypothetical protein
MMAQNMANAETILRKQKYDIDMKTTTEHQNKKG